MIFRQLFDFDSFTYSYLIASKKTQEGVLIDPVLHHVDQYTKLFDELGLRLVMAIDTHVHADHITGLGELRKKTECTTIMGKESRAECVSVRVKEGDVLTIGDISLQALYTPGHTDDSYSFLMKDRIFTGDTLLIRGTGRTDFQNGDSYAQYDSLFNKILKLDDDIVVYPAHDYNGFTKSTIGEEKNHNPRLKVQSADAYADLMAGLNLPNPKYMDVAVPANLKCGLRNGLGE